MRTTRALAACAVAMLGIGACSGDDDADRDGSNDPRERIEYAVTNIPEDRATGAVEAALGRLDACALVDPQGAGVQGFRSAEIEARSPHSCTATNREYDDVTVVLGVELSTDDRFTNKLTSFGGAKAYVLPSTDKDAFCRVALPVSFTHTIEIRGSSSGSDGHACATAKAFASVAAERLDAPDSVELDVAQARQTACDVLRPAVDLERGTEVRFGSDFTSGMDRCEVWDSQAEGEIFAPVAPNSYLSIEYAAPSADYYDKDFGRIAGRRIQGDDSTECILAWQEWKPPVSVGDGDVAQFQVSAPSCAEGKRLVARIADVIDQDRVESNTTPQRPVLYEPDDPDSPAVGACADLATFEESDCEPYADAEAPSTGKQTIAAADNDPNVNCAIAKDAVQEHFGSAMSPVTALYGAEATGQSQYACGFVEESHALQVWIAASKDPMNQTPGSEIDGHPAHDVTTVSDGTREMWVALDDPERPGHLYAEVRVLPSRDDGMFSNSPVDEKPLEKLDEAINDIVSAHFS